MKLTKLDALRILGNAYWYLASAEDYKEYRSNEEPASILEEKFGYIRRSLSLRDVIPQRDTEGWNGKGPTQF